MRGISRSRTLVGHLEARLRALRANAAALLQTAAAAGIAWYLAHDAIGHRSAFFAPIAAVIVLGLSPGNRTRRAVEVALGVGVGILVGDALIAAIGRGPWQVALVVLLAMSGAILFGGGPLVISQAAASAVLVATVATSGHHVVPTRFVDALVGGAVGIAVLAIVPRDPARLARRTAAPLFAGLASTLDELAAALEAGDLDAVREALERARGLDQLVAQLDDSLELAAETTRLAPTQWHERGRVERYATAATHLGLAVRNVRVLARGAVRAVELEPEIPEGLVVSIRDLAASVRAIEPALERGEAGDEARRRSLAAAAAATATLEQGMGFAIDVLVGQVRSTATDLLRALGDGQGEAVAEVRAAAGERP